MSNVNIKRMVVGFMFDTLIEKVVLIRKEKPLWQAGKHNGVGGKFEESDATYADAMVREFQEETGLATERTDWVNFGRIHGPDWSVQMFAARYMQGTPPVESMTNEVVGVFALQRLPLIDDSLLDDVMWMIHAARFSLYPGGPKWVDTSFKIITEGSFEDVTIKSGLIFPSAEWDAARAAWDRSAGERDG